MSKSNNSSGGIGFIGLLTISFIVLKLVGVIDWNWIWILSPLWIAAFLIIVIFVIPFLFLLKISKKYEK